MTCLVSLNIVIKNYNFLLIFEGNLNLETFHVGSVQEFKDRDKKVLILNDSEVGIFRMGKDFFAYENLCPHQGGPVCQGRLFSLVKENLDDNSKSHGRLYDENNLNIVCPWHGLEFDIRTGKHPGNPKIKLKSFPIKVDREEVYVTIK